MKHLLTMFALVSSCSQLESKEIKTQNEKIKSISISRYGGEMGYSQGLKITADSLCYGFGLVVEPTKNRHQEKENKLYKLESIISAAQLISFSKVKDGRSRLPVDGTDTRITIATEKRSYSVTNGEGNKIWTDVETKIEIIAHKEFEIE